MATVSYIPTFKLVSLLQAVDPQKSLNVRVMNSTTLSLENDTFKQIATIDFATEEVTNVEGRVPLAIVETPKASRKRGEYELVAFGREVKAYSLKDLLAEGLKALEEHKPGTLESLSKVKPGTKRIVARNPADLFDSEGLSEKYSAKLSEIWWYGTNNSAQETEAWLKRACDCAGVEWNSSDFAMNS